MKASSVSFFEQTPIFILDRHSLDILDINDSASHCYGYSRSEFQSMNMKDLGYPGKMGELVNGWPKEINLDEDIWVHHAKDGEELYVQFTSHHFQYKGRPAKFAVAHDVSSQVGENGKHKLENFSSQRDTDKNNQEESQNLFRTLSEKSLVGVFLIQDDGFEYVNPHLAEMFGYDQQKIVDDLTPFDLIHPADHSLIRKNIQDRLNGIPGPEKYEVKGITNNGSEIDLSIYGSKISYNGQPAIVGTVLDITENKEIVQKYKSSVDTFRTLFDSISDAIYIQDSKGRFLEVNEGAEQMYGYSKEYLLGKRPQVLAAPGKVDLLKLQTLTQKVLNGKPQSFNWWGKRKNGEVFPKEIVMNPGTYFGKDVIITIARDISDRYQAEEELRKNEEMFRQLFQNSPIATVLMDKRQEITSVNDAFNDTFGYTTEEIHGLNIDKVIVPEEEQEMAHEISNTIFDGESAFHTGKRLCKDGSLVDVLIYGVPVTVDGKTISIFGIYVDITDRKQAEEKIRKSLKEKEVLLAEIHHRVKNNLAVITGLLELQAYNTDSEDATEVLVASQMRVNSIALIHEKLYQNEDLSEISFDTYLKELTDVIVASVQSAATDVSISIDAEPIKLTINQAIPCGLILNELITNAYKHAFIDQEAGNISISVKSDSDDFILGVCDNGIGIPDEISLDKPNTLGLKLIDTLSKQLEGVSDFINTGSGTQFTLRFQLEK